jgi:hypothetical protein
MSLFLSYQDCCEEEEEEDLLFQQQDCGGFLHHHLPLKHQSRIVVILVLAIEIESRS